MPKKYSKKSGEVIKLSKQRIIELFEEADKEFNNDKKLANRYVHLARKIAMKYNIRMSKELKRKF